LKLLPVADFPVGVVAEAAGTEDVGMVVTHPRLCSDANNGRYPGDGSLPR